MDILLVNAPYTVKIRPLCERIGLGYIAAVLRRNGYRVTILDLPLMGMEIKKTVKHVRAGKYSLIGVSIPFEEEFPLALKLLRQLRKVDAGAHITVGGHFPTFAHASLLHDFNEIDSVVRGEGEYTMLNLASALESRADLRTIPGLSFREDGNVAINPPRPLVENLDSLPFPARDTLVYSLRQDGVASVVGSRGCYGNCSFCSVNAFYRSAPGKSWRGRTTQNILSEIETLIEGWGVKEIGFEDD
ncbi:MAG: B12-binding domain-containing radical SAM protein, partial [bacterium]